jgi:nucleotide-binding universal stress UspA family protein
VADRVLRASKVPVWLVPAQISHTKWTMRKILVPLDGSELAEVVLPHVEMLAKTRKNKIEVVLFRVSEAPVFLTASTPESTMDWGKLIEKHLIQAGKVAEQYLADIGDRLTDAGLSVDSEALVGEPAHEIIDYAAQNHFDLIAMASHGHSGLSRWAYGNVADKVIHGASCPVLLVRPQSS